MLDVYTGVDKAVEKSLACEFGLPFSQFSGLNSQLVQVIPELSTGL